MVTLDSHEGRQLISELRAAELTLLVGSGVSSFRPTGLSTGMALGRAIAERLAAGGASNCSLLMEILSETAFEHVMERAPDYAPVREVLSRRFRGVEPNVLHHALVRLAASGVVRHVVTPNYDVAIERAFAAAAPPVELALLRGAAEAANARGGAAHVLFKIHGCATPAFAEEMVFRLTDEAQLEPWKRDALRTLVAGRALVVVAYSGMDFEICPELPGIGASRLVWLHFGDPGGITPNARRVVRQSGGVFLLGSVQALLGALLGQDAVDAEWAPGSADDLAGDLLRSFGGEELDAWRARLFGEIGCARDAVAAASRLLAAAAARGDTAAFGRALAHRGRGRFHAGRYFDAAEDYAGAAKIFRRISDAHELRGALAGIVESNRCAGRYARVLPALFALGRLARARGAGRERQPARADRRMLGFLLRRHVYQIVSLLPRGRGSRRARKRLRAILRAWARRDISAVAEFAANAGNWLQLQQAMLWANRYGLRWSTVFRGTMNPLPPEEGYRQLGYVVARSMAIRDARRPPPPAEVGKVLEMLAGVGAWPEAWKLARFTRQRHGPGSVHPDLLRTIEAGWRDCQYTRSMRWAREKGIF